MAERDNIFHNLSHSHFVRKGENQSVTVFIFIGGGGKAFYCLVKVRQQSINWKLFRGLNVLSRERARNGLRGRKSMTIFGRGDSIGEFEEK